MKFISHRGNVNGRISPKENSPPYINSAIYKGFDVEVDVWFVGEEIFLGHDQPQYQIKFEWLVERIDKLWIHCKNMDSIYLFAHSTENFNYFWHENDTITLTSLNYIWAFPGKQPIKESIAVMPELYNDDVSLVCGICSDYIEEYKVLYDSNCYK